MEVLKVLAAASIINAIPEYDILFIGSTVEQRKGITFHPFTRHESFIPIITWDQG